MRDRREEGLKINKRKIQYKKKEERRKKKKEEESKREQEALKIWIHKFPNRKVSEKGGGGPEKKGGLHTND